MSRQSHPLTNEEFMDGMFVGIFIGIFMGIFMGTTLRAVWHLIFLRWMDSDCFDVTEWKSVAEAGA
jgi:hypothetical protein